MLKNVRPTMVETTLPKQEASSPQSSAVTSAPLGSTMTVSVVLAAIALAAAFFGSDIPAWSWMYQLWMTNPDNSHGLLVPAFSSWLLWHRRNLISFPKVTVSNFAMITGIGLVVAAMLLRFLGIFSRTITYEAASVLPCVAGIILILFGWAGARWAWPAVAFLVFMIPLPGSIGGMLGGSLQSLATICSTFTLQTIGIPAVSEGNIIWLTEKPLGVAQACSGLRMMTSFFALASGVALVIERPLWERWLIILSAPLIAIASNVLRISATAIAYEFGNEKMAEMIFHDLAGWLMMPTGLLLLWAELFLMSKVFQIEEEANFYSRR